MNICLVQTWLRNDTHLHSHKISKAFPLWHKKYAWEKNAMKILNKNLWSQKLDGYSPVVKEWVSQQWKLTFVLTAASQYKTNILFYSFCFVLFWNQKGKVKIYLLLSGLLEITAVTWAGFTIILELLELPLGSSSTQRESNIPSIYLLTYPGREIKHSISKAGDFSFTDFALSFENWIPLHMKIKQSSLCSAWGVVKYSKNLFILNKIRSLNGSLPV